MAMPRLEERLKSLKVRWRFTKEELAQSPSCREHGVEPDRELSYRQQAANMIQDMGQKLNVNQLCINTAIVYMHRFYMVHSFKTFNRHLVATASLFLAAKSEEQPRKLHYVAQISHSCLNKDEPKLEVQSQAYAKLIEDITYYELLLLETLGFEVQVDHPHPHVVKCMHFLKASKDLSQMAYFMAHNSLLLTTFCLEHSPATVACVCIHLSCQWKGIDIPRSSDGKNWWEYIDPSINKDKLDALTKEFLMIYDKSPSRLQKKITEPMRLQSSSQLSSKSSSGLSSDKGKHPTHPSLLHTHPKHPHQKSHGEGSGHSSKPHPEHKIPHSTSTPKDHKQPHAHTHQHSMKLQGPHGRSMAGQPSRSSSSHPSSAHLSSANRLKSNPALAKPPHKQSDTHLHSHTKLPDASRLHSKPSDSSRTHSTQHPLGVEQKYRPHLEQNHDMLALKRKHQATIDQTRGIKRIHMSEKEMPGKKRIKVESNQPPLPSHDLPPLPPLPPLPHEPPPHFHPPPLPSHATMFGKQRLNSDPPLPPPLPPSPSPPPPPPPR